MTNHFDNIGKIAGNIYTAWLLVVTNLISIIFSKTHTFNFSFFISLLTIAIFAPILYRYYITKTTDVWDNLKD